MNFSLMSILQYSADVAKVSRLLKAPLYFDLEMYNSAQWLEKVTVENCSSNRKAGWNDTKWPF